MAKGKKKENLTPEERLQAELVPDWEQPYKVPENWCWTTQNTVATFLNGRAYKQNELLEDDTRTPILRVGNLFTNSSWYYSNLELDSDKYIDNGDLIYAWSASFGPFIWVGNKVIYHYHIWKVILSSAVQKKYMYFWLLYDTERLKQGGHGTGMIHVTKAMMEAAFVPLPPLSEQQRIVDRIESLFAKLDEAKQKAQYALDSFETRKAAILHKAFTGELTAQWRKEHGVGMESWDYPRFEDCILKMQNGLAKRSGSSGTSFVVLRLANLSDNGFVTDDLREILLDEKEQKNYSLKDNDVLMIRVNGSKDNVGKQFLFYGKLKWAFCDHIIRITYKTNLSPEYMVYFSKTNTYRRYIEDNMVSSAGQNTISRKGMASLLIPIPLMDEQTEIVRILDDLLAKEQQAKEAAEAVLEQIDLIKKSILARAFRGELGTNDPTEESAVELVKEVIERSSEINSKPKTKVKRTVIPAEIKSVLSNTNEEEIVKLLMKSAPKAVSVQKIMSISKKKFELMDALRNLEQKQIIIKDSFGEYLLKG